MTGINHKQAQRYLRAQADGLLRENQRALLDAHLRDCDSCRAEADELNALEARLQKNFQARWDTNDGPSKNVMTTIQSRSRRIIMTNRINTALKTAAGLTALLVLIFLFNPVFKQIQEYSQQPGSTSSTPYPLTATENISTQELSTPDSPPLLSVKEAEKIAGFDVLEPTYLPTGFTFQGAICHIQDKSVELTYSSLPTSEGLSESGIIVIYQKRGVLDFGPRQYPYETPVPIGDVEGIFIRGAYVSESPDTTDFKWDASANIATLSWRKDNMAFAISFLGGETIPPIQLNGLRAIAESMKHVVVANESITPQPYNRLIAFVSMQDGGDRDIFTMKADGSDVTNLTNNPATDDSPAWSPDGTKIAFVSDRDGGRDIYLINADGSNLRKLTDSSTFNDRFTWSPDGQKIVYLEDHYPRTFNARLMIMNADGSNKTALTPQPGKYDFLSWSPDGQNIVYQASDLGEDKVSRVMVVNINGTAVSDGPFFEGDAGRQHYRVSWETPNQFITISSNFEQTRWGRWNITRFFTNGNNNNYNGSNPILATSENPILAVFENTYVTLDQGSLVWFSYKDEPIPHSPWKLDSVCKPPVKQTTFDIQKSPDDKYGFIGVDCGNGTSAFYLANAVGDEILQLGGTFEGTPLPFAVWSPDGKYVVMAIANKRSQELYLFDIEKMLTDPSAQPSQLTTDKNYKYGAVWQP